MLGDGLSRGASRCAGCSDQARLCLPWQQRFDVDNGRDGRAAGAGRCVTRLAHRSSKTKPWCPTVVEGRTSTPPNTGTSWRNSVESSSRSDLFKLANTFAAFAPSVLTRAAAWTGNGDRSFATSSRSGCTVDSDGPPLPNPRLCRMSVLAWRTRISSMMLESWRHTSRASRAVSTWSARSSELLPAAFGPTNAVNGANVTSTSRSAR